MLILQLLKISHANFFFTKIFDFFNNHFFFIKFFSFLNYLTIISIFIYNIEFQLFFLNTNMFDNSYERSNEKNRRCLFVEIYFLLLLL